MNSALPAWRLRSAKRLAARRGRRSPKWRAHANYRLMAGQLTQTRRLDEHLNKLQVASFDGSGQVCWNVAVWRQLGDHAHGAIDPRHACLLCLDLRFAAMAIRRRLSASREQSTGGAAAGSSGHAQAIAGTAEHQQANAMVIARLERTICLSRLIITMIRRVGRFQRRPPAILTASGRKRSRSIATTPNAGPMARMANAPDQPSAL